MISEAGFRSQSKTESCYCPVTEKEGIQSEALYFH